MRLWHLAGILVIGIIATMIVAHYRGWTKLEKMARGCVCLMSFLGGVFFFCFGVIYMISDFRQSPIATSNYSGPGLGFMIGGGMLLFLGIPLIAGSILLFRYKKNKG